MPPTQADRGARSGWHHPQTNTDPRQRVGTTPWLYKATSFLIVSSSVEARHRSGKVRPWKGQPELEPGLTRVDSHFYHALSQTKQQTEPPPLGFLMPASLQRSDGKEVLGRVWRAERKTAWLQVTPLAKQAAVTSFWTQMQRTGLTKREQQEPDGGAAG